MRNIFHYIQGDRAIWAVTALLAVFSFMPVYSASSNLAYMYGDGSTLPFLLKHFAHLLLGFAILYGVHKIPFNYFRGLSIIALPVIIILLLITLAGGNTIQGANASRWLRVPIVGVGFQTSTLAAVVLMTYVARYLSRIKDKVVTFKETLLPLWLPVFLVLGLILPANFSTTAIIFTMVFALMFVGGYPIRYLGIVFLSGLVCLMLFVGFAKVTNIESLSVKVNTWENRIKNFSNNEDTEGDYQIERAKMSIASGKLFGLGPGKGVGKNFLPQVSSDFIYAIIAEEYGLVGALSLLFLYLLLLFRLVIVAHKSTSLFGKLLVIGVGLPIVFQALINMAVAVELFPVTGQTLPLISSGGTSIWMTCLALGMVLSVSAKRVAVKTDDLEENPLDILSETI